MIAIDPSLIALRQTRFRGQEGGWRLAARPPLHYTPPAAKTSVHVVSGDSPALSSNSTGLVGRSRSGKPGRFSSHPCRSAASWQSGLRRLVSPAFDAGRSDPILDAPGNGVRPAATATCPRDPPRDARHSAPHHHIHQPTQSARVVCPKFGTKRRLFTTVASNQKNIHMKDQA